MAEEKELLKVGKYNLMFNDILKTNIQDLDIYMSKGLPAHMIKRKHFKCLKYLDNISEIITNPDYDCIVVDSKKSLLTHHKKNSILELSKEYSNTKHDYSEVGNGSRRTLHRVPEMMDTPPILNNDAFIIIY